VLKKEEMGPNVPEHRRFPFNSKEGRMAEKLNSYPKIKAATQKVADNDGIKKWLATRGVQNF